MASRRTLALVALVALVALAGCGASTGGGSDGGAGGGLEQATEIAADTGARATGTPAATGEPEEAGSGASDDVSMPTDRAIIRTGTVVVEVEDFGAAQSNLTTTVEGYGGYVSDSRQDRRQIGNETWVRGEMVLRVPSEDFDALVEDAQALGEVQTVEVNSRDVSDQLVDIEARLENLRAERDRLRELYDRANDTEDVLAVQRELSDVQTEIERTEAQLQGLERRVAYSTITVELREPRPDYEPPERSAWYETPLTEAFFDSVQGVIVLGRGAVVLTAYALPYLFVLAVPAIGVAWGYRRARR